jgi:hypothetical protein
MARLLWLFGALSPLTHSRKIRTETYKSQSYTKYSNSSSAETPTSLIKQPHAHLIMQLKFFTLVALATLAVAGPEFDPDSPIVSGIQCCTDTHDEGSPLGIAFLKLLSIKPRTANASIAGGCTVGLISLHCPICCLLSVLQPLPKGAANDEDADIQCDGELLKCINIFPAGKSALNVWQQF